MAISQATLELLITMKDQASEGVKSLGGSLLSLGGIAGGAALAGVAALGGAIASGVGDAREAAQIMAQTEAVIKSTGNAAGTSAEHVADLATSLSAASGTSLFGDAQIQESTNLLLTFTNLREGALDAATAISVDMAQALGGEPKAAAIQLGKALNDPINGVSALTRVGVTFTDQQKEQIETMQEAGDMAGAQAVIIAELNKEFGGSAKAAADADGGFAQFNDVMGELFETVGAELLPILKEFGAWLNSPEVQAALKAFGENLANGIRIAADFVMNTLIPAIRDLWNWLSPILMPILNEVGRALSEDLPKGIQVVVDTWNALKQALSDFKTGYIDPIVNGFNLVVNAITEADRWLKNVTGTLASIVIPSWLQGHSPPPLANWLNSIAGAADNASEAAGGVGFGTRGAGFASAAGGSTSITVGQIVVQGAANPEQTALLVRNELLKLGNRNLDIFGGKA